MADKTYDVAFKVVGGDVFQNYGNVIYKDDLDLNTKAFERFKSVLMTRFPDGRTTDNFKTFTTAAPAEEVKRKNAKKFMIFKDDPASHTKLTDRVNVVDDDDREGEGLIEFYPVAKGGKGRKSRRSTRRRRTTRRR
jgi:hypothetical protein